MGDIIDARDQTAIHRVSPFQPTVHRRREAGLTPTPCATCGCPAWQEPPVRYFRDGAWTEQPGPVRCDACNPVRKSGQSRPLRMPQEPRAGPPPGPGPENAPEPPRNAPQEESMPTPTSPLEAPTTENAPKCAYERCSNLCPPSNSQNKSAGPWRKYCSTKCSKDHHNHQRGTSHRQEPETILPATPQALEAAGFAPPAAVDGAVALLLARVEQLEARADYRALTIKNADDDQHRLAELEKSRDWISDLITAVVNRVSDMERDIVRRATTDEVASLRERTIPMEAEAHRVGSWLSALANQTEALESKVATAHHSFAQRLTMLEAAEHPVSDYAEVASVEQILTDIADRLASNTAAHIPDIPPVIEQARARDLWDVCREAEQLAREFVRLAQPGSTLVQLWDNILHRVQQEVA